MAIGKKKFDIGLYNANDNLARESVKKLFDGSGLEVRNNAKKTDVDLQVYKDNVHLFNIECEIKRVWTQKDFPYESVQFPSRKEKYAKLDKPTYFIMFNNDQSSYLVVKGSDLLASPQKEVPNRYVYKGEVFFQVNLNNVTMNSVEKIIKENSKNDDQQ